MSDASWLPVLGLGAAVGLGVAMPLGAIGVLLLQTGMTRGWRTAAAGGLGAATVDLAFAVVAVLAGTTVTRLLDGHETTVRLVGALVLAAVAVHGLLTTLRRRPARPRADDGAATVAARGPLASFGRFVALTAVNPLTVVYFTVVAAGLADRLGTPARQVAFVVGIGAASAAWQLALAGAGALVGARVGERVRLTLALAGYLVVGALAVVLATRP
ncbi:LysE family transporter [Cellulomonas sp. APG4]|uniref:LysE family transporter n=1 Tax=Cellulomonas sp. APG4 TaxID=1538656 RepID=UPI0013799CB6|nr:LysE family transporter [Cellulomonas sp. APG4]